MWKTTNGGDTWQPMFDDVYVASIGAVAVAPSEPATVYVGTGTHGQRLYALAGSGGRGGAGSRALYRSDDGGDTWTFATRRLASAGCKIYAHHDS